MNNNQIFLSALFLTAGLLAACSKDDDQTNIEPRRISVEVSERPMTADAPAAARELTRSEITTTSTLEAFSMRAIYSSETFEYTIGKSYSGWTVTPATWPSSAPNATKVPFYAYTSGTFYANNGSPYVNFDIAENASTQHDLLVAGNSVAHSDHDGKVPLTFDHACAALQFYVQMTNTLNTNLGGKTLTVSSIVLRNVNNTGRYNFGTGAWSNVTGSSYYTLTNSSITITTTPQALSSNCLFLIPQERAADGTTGTYLDITYAFEGQTATQAIIPLDVNWVKGTRYTINIKLGTSLIK